MENWDVTEQSRRNRNSGINVLQQKTHIQKMNPNFNLKQLCKRDFIKEYLHPDLFTTTTTLYPNVQHTTIHPEWMRFLVSPKITL